MIMKQILQVIFTAFLFVLACFWVSACEGKDEFWEGGDQELTNASYGSLHNNHVVATGDVKDVTETSATILFSANYNYKVPFGIKPGIIYSTSKNDLKCGAPNTTQIEVKDFISSSLEVNLENLEHGTTYYYCAYAVADGKEHYSDVKSFTTPFDYSKLEGVDLGLSVKWAIHNIGASQPEELGESFYWGETSASTSKDWHDFALSTLVSHGYIDNNNNLCSSYDTATELWGDKWRMPTKDEFLELIDKCEWKIVKKNGEEVALITGPNGNFIYMPNGGYFLYWTSSCSSSKAYYFEWKTYYSIFYNSNRRIIETSRAYNYYIRPVMK